MPHPPPSDRHRCERVRAGELLCLGQAVGCCRLADEAIARIKQILTEPAAMMVRSGGACRKCDTLSDGGADTWTRRQQLARTGHREGSMNLRSRRGAMRAAVVSSISALALAACQAIENEEAQDTEQLLAAAGFHMKEATTPEQLANLQAMTQRQIVTHHQDGQLRYVYADAKDCKCVYVGNERNYDEYQKLLVKKEIAQENLDASLDWDMWGPWPIY
jgi:hypothetical protein